MWNEKYADAEYFYGQAPNQWLVMNRERFPATGRALAIADGEGRNGVYLAECGLDIDTVDGSEVGVAKSLELAHQRGVSINAVHADLAAYDLGEQDYDLIVAIYAHFPGALRQSVHAGCARALKSGGLFVLEAFHPEQLGRKSGGPGKVEMLYTVEQVLQDFEGCQVLEAQQGLTWLDEGRHAGLGYVTRVVVRKD